MIRAFYSSNSTSSSSSSSSEAPPVLIEQRVAFTVVASLSAAIMIAGSILLLSQRKEAIYRRKTSQYMILASVGLLFYIRDNLAILWQWPEYNDDLTSFLLYYLIAVPVHFLPILLRSWKITCVYKLTPNWNCSWDTPMSGKQRGHKWMLIRLGILYLIWPLVAFLIFSSENNAYYLWIAIELLFALTNLGLAFVLWSLRKELQKYVLDDSKSLIGYSCVAVIECIVTNTFYMFAEEDSIYLVPYLWADITLVNLMWWLSVGRTLINVIVKKNKTRKSLDPTSAGIQLSQSVKVTLETLSKDRKDKDSCDV